VNNRIYIDRQTKRNCWRLRVMIDGKNTFAVYLKSKAEAKKSQRFLKKFVSTIDKKVNINECN